jgi:hypothetical protein
MRFNVNFFMNYKSINKSKHSSEEAYAESNQEPLYMKIWTDVTAAYVAAD